MVKGENYPVMFQTGFGGCVFLCSSIARTTILGARMSLLKSKSMCQCNQVQNFLLCRNGA